MSEPERNEAKELYVEEGLGINTIFGIFEGKFPLRILYKWRKEDNWDKDRINYRKKEIPLKVKFVAILSLITANQVSPPSVVLHT